LWHSENLFNSVSIQATKDIFREEQRDWEFPEPNGDFKLLVTLFCENLIYPTIHCFLHDVWVNYQPNCPKSHFSRRTQSRDPYIATAALRRFAWLLGRGARARKQGLDLGTKLMIGLLESNGQAMLAQSIVAHHQQTQPDSDEDDDVPMSMLGWNKGERKWFDDEKEEFWVFGTNDEVNVESFCQKTTAWVIR
jgi:hypothetical protein